MSKIALSPSASGTGTLTIAAPNTNSDFTLSLPATTAPILAGSGITLSASAPANTLVTDASGNVGIGTSSPGALLTVTKNQNAQTEIGVTNSDTTNTSSRARVRALCGTVDTIVTSIAGLGSFVGASSNHELNLITNGSTRAVIDSSGNVAIGGATSSRRFSVYLNAATNYAGEFIQQSATGHAIAAVCNSSDTNGRYFDGYSDSAGASRIIIYSNGNVQNTNNSYGALSDLKLKENIVDATPKLDKLNQVRVVNYNLKDTPDQKLLGVVAQELEQIFPGMIEETSDFDREGNDLGTTTKAVKYSVFVPMLIKAIQELNAKVDAQAAEIAALKGQA